MKSFTRLRLLLEGLRHYWRTNLAIVLGVVVGTAVIGGALIVGDSVRASLRQMTLDRLGQIDLAVTGPRFFREQLATDLSGKLGTTGPKIAPALVLVAGVERKTGDQIRRAGQVNIYGVDQRAWDLVQPPGIAPPQGDGVFINSSLAQALNAQVGDSLTLWLELPSAVPRDTLLGKRDNDAQEVTVTVAQILPDAPGAARLGLQPTQQLPNNLFIALSRLQSALDLEEVAPSRRDPLGQRARVNTLFSSAWPAADAPPAGGESKSANEILQQVWQLDDLHLRIVVDDTLKVLSLESDQMLLENRFADAVEAFGQERGLAVSPVMVYLANWLRNAEHPEKYSMYSTVAGLDVLDLPDAFGPYEFVGATPDSFGVDDIIINQFLAEDLQVQVGDTIRFAYHLVGSHGELPEEERTATVRGIVAMEGAATDRQLTPTVKGITDADSLNDWEQPFSMDLDAVTPRDDEYWDEYRATPKAYFPLHTAQTLWPNRYGNFTSIRIAPPPDVSLEAFQAELTQHLRQTLKPADVGLAFQPIRTMGLQAASGSTDFTGLFVGFSFFLILAAVILVGLLFRLAAEQRLREWGLLAALGFRPRTVGRLMLAEGALLVVVGATMGALAAIGYAQLMLYGLKTWWIGAIGTRFLFLSIQPISVAIGMATASVASLVAILAARWQLKHLSVRRQLVGDSEAAQAPTPKSARRARRLAVCSLLCAVLLIGGILTGVIPSTEAFSGLSWPVVLFFVAGMLSLAAGLWGFSAWLQGESAAAVQGRGVPALFRLGWRNAARQRQRSVLTTGLIASATFVIAAVAAGHKNPTEERPNKASGNGGFTLVAESSSPILYDLNTAVGRKTLNLQPKTPEQTAALAVMHVTQFRMKPGQDASCLNLFQTSVPTLLGVPESMIERGGFKFIGGGSQPWEVLNQRPEDGSIPVLGDMNTLMFSLKKGPGQKLPIPSADHPEHQLQIAGMFDGAVFQGVLLMAEDQFLKLYPSQKGYQYFLIEVPPEHAEAAAELLETDLAEYGFDTEPVAERLARFLAVQNTYLSTFQSLGGLGLLLGTLGLATVMLRNVLERQAELALLRAVGFRPRQIGTLILAETSLLLMWGLATGTLAALLSMAPHLTTMGADVPWGSGALLLAAVAALGLAAAGWAVRTAVRLPIVATLRGE